MKKRHSAEQIVARLCRANVDSGKGLKVPEVCRQPGISKLATAESAEAGIPQHVSCATMGQSVEAANQYYIKMRDETREACRTV
jgi:hypothetical protein